MEEGAHGGDNLRQAILSSFLPGRMISSQAPGLSFLQTHQLHGQGEGGQGQALHDRPVFCKEKRRARRPSGSGPVHQFQPDARSHSSPIPNLLAGASLGHGGVRGKDYT